MTREEMKNEFFGMSDLKRRWGYKSVNAVRLRRKYDKKFPEPVTILNKRVLVFWLPDIEAYEKHRGGITTENNRFTFYQNLEEWNNLSESERRERRNDFFDERSRLQFQLKRESKATLPKGNV